MHGAAKAFRGARIEVDLVALGVVGVAIIACNGCDWTRPIRPGNDVDDLPDALDDFLIHQGSEH